MRPLLLATACLAAAFPAHAAMTVIGSGAARQCYLAALSRSGAQVGLETCDRALAEEPLGKRDQAATLVNRGIVRLHAREEASALIDFDAALAVSPGLPEAKVNKAVALVRMDGDKAAAISLVNEALAAGVSKPEVAHYARAVAHELMGDLAAAYRDYRRAAELKPGWSDPARQLERFTVVRGRA